MTQIEKLELALKLMKDRKHDVAGLGGPIAIIKDVIDGLKDSQDKAEELNNGPKYIQ